MGSEGVSQRVDAQGAGRHGGADEGAVDPFGEEEKIVSEAERKGMTREQAVEVGRRLGSQEADRRGEVGDWRKTRVARAMLYAAWEYDGKPLDRGAAYRAEFGVPEPALSDPRISTGADFLKERK